jgi:putative peptidoglycan lipid II flippase
MLRRMGPVLIGLGTLQLNSFMDTLIAMWPNWVGPTIAGHDYPLDERANAVLFYAQRLYQFPLGVFGIAVATAAFPMLSRDAGDPARFAATMRRGVRLSLFIALPATAGLVVVRGPLVDTLFTGMGDGFSAEGVTRASLVLLGYSVAIWAYSLNQLYTRAFYASGDTATPMRIAVSMVGLNLALNMVLIWWLREAGLAWSTAITAILQTALLARAARRGLIGGPLLDTETGRSVGWFVMASAGVAMATGLLLWGWAPSDSWALNAVRTSCAVLLGVAVYAGWAIGVGRPELGWLLGRFGRGTIRSSPKPPQEGGSES